MMFFRLSKKSKVKKILLISLSNIGDVILTFPVFDVLSETFPNAEITVVVGPRAKGLLVNNPHVHKVYVFDKKASLKDWWRWLKKIRVEAFDLVVDLRNSMMPFLVRGRVVTRPALAWESRGHMKEKHLRRLALVLKDVRPALVRNALYISSADEQCICGILRGAREYVVVAPGAADQRKRWPEEKFADLVGRLVRVHKARVVIVGDKNDARIAERIMVKVPHGVVSLAGQTTLVQLGAVLQGAKLAVTNDSGIMHMASYLDVPVVALFGPTDPDRYGPWGSVRHVIRKGCDMNEVPVEDVFSVVDNYC